MAQSRRDFLWQSGGAFGAALAAAGIERFGLINALAQSQLTDYKALVCIFLLGGNDGNNTVVPVDDYADYGAVRGASSLAIPQANLLGITPPSIGRRFGLNPFLPGLQSLWQQQKLAVLCNVGPLVQPLTRTEYQSGVGRPYQLFSHADQQAQWQTSVSNNPAQIGWGGRTADTMFGVNGDAPLPMLTSLAGTNVFATGRNTRPLVIAPAPTPLNQVLALELPGLPADPDALKAAMQQLRQLNTDATLVASVTDTTTKALMTSEALSVDPTLATAFPNSLIGNQLKQVAKLISLRDTLGLKRQIFFCALGGFDTHANQTGPQGTLLAQVSAAMKAFYDATVILGVSDRVTTFTLSDFGRTLEPSGAGNGKVGSDHAWGNHHFIMGGAVRGGDFYGTPGPNGTVFPTLRLGGPDDAGSRGQWIPTTSVEQYGATLATWYGLSVAELPTVFPFIGRFPAADLGFLV